MSQKRRKFSAQFKAEAVQLVIGSKRPVAEVARDLGISEGTLGNWVNRYRAEHPEPPRSLSPIHAARLAAGVLRSSWNVIDRTGQAAYEARLTGQLTRNGLSSYGTELP